MDYSKSGDLKESYQKIARALLTIEKDSGLYTLLTNKSPEVLRSELAFIPNEVLESYLEDLLDISVSNQKLFIENQNRFNAYSMIAIVGVITAIFLGLKAMAKGEDMTTAAFLIFLTATPCVLVYSLIPKKPNRRLFFAKLISLELERRNGGGSNQSRISKRLADFIPHSERFSEVN